MKHFFILISIFFISQSLFAYQESIALLVGYEGSIYQSDEVEINLITDYLTEMNLSIDTVMYEPVNGISYNDISYYDLIILVNHGWHWAFQSTVDALIEAYYVHHKKLYLIGDDITNGSAGIQNIPKLTHFELASSNGTDGNVQIINNSHPIVSGPYGVVENFYYGGDLDITETIYKGEIFIAKKEGTNNALINVYTDSSGNKKISQLPNLSGTGGQHHGELGTENSIKNLKILFKNSIYWLLNNDISTINKYSISYNYKDLILCSSEFANREISFCLSNFSNIDSIFFEFGYFNFNYIVDEYPAGNLRKYVDFNVSMNDNILIEKKNIVDSTTKKLKLNITPFLISDSVKIIIKNLGGGNDLVITHPRLIVYGKSLTGMNFKSNLVPSNVKLFQNFPNPFNPITNIEYSISKPSKVKIIIYNSLGQKINTLLDSYQLSGKYNIIWNGTDDSGKLVSSGTYFYQLIVNNNILNKRMVYIK